MASSSLSGTFSYVFIPANEEAPVELKQGDKSGGLSDDILVKAAKDYFHQNGGGQARAAALEGASPAQRRALAQQLRAQLTASNTNTTSRVADNMTDEALLDLVKSTRASPSCEIMALTVPTQGNQYQAVSLYSAPEQEQQQGSWNRRATALVQACGHAAPPPSNNDNGDSQQPAGVYGDVFVGRCFDREETDVWERVDFTVEHADPTSDWCRIARSPGGGGGSGAAASSLSGVMSQTIQQQQQQQISSSKEEDGLLQWSQTDDEVELKFSVASGTKAKYVKVQFGRETLKVMVAGQTLVHGSTGGKVSVEESTYTIQDEVETGNRELCIILGKNETGTIWPFAVRSK